MKPDVSVIIVTYNSADEIEDCLGSIYAQDSTLKQEVVIVDNLSQDRTVEIIKEKFPQAKLILPGENLGFAKGVNLGVRESEGEYVLLLNPDTQIIDNAIEVVTQFARENPQYGLYGGRTLQPDLTLEPSSCWGAPTLWSMTMFAFGLTTLAPRHPILDPESLGQWNRDTVREVGIITGCFLLAKRDLWEKLDGFDERYFMYGEDADLALRARKLGKNAVICPDAKLIHEVGKSSKTPTHKMRLLYKGKASLIRTHWNGFAQSFALNTLVAGTGLRAALATIISRVKDTELDDRWTTLWAEREDWIKGWTS